MFRFPEKARGLSALESVLNFYIMGTNSAFPKGNAGGACAEIKNEWCDVLSPSHVFVM